MTRTAKRNYNSENLIKGQKICILVGNELSYIKMKKLKVKDQCNVTQCCGTKQKMMHQSKKPEKNQKISHIYIQEQNYIKLIDIFVQKYIKHLFFNSFYL